MPAATSCHDIFDTARLERTEHPLTKGQYKLDEAMQVIESWQRLVLTVAERERTGRKFNASETLGVCLASERGTYLKSIPKRLAKLIGNDILPAIAALEGDGLAKAEVQRRLSRAETAAKRLIAECEAARLRLKGGIESEYRAMRRGEGALLALLDAALEITRTKDFGH